MASIDINCAWIGYSVILLAALALNIDILVLSTQPRSNMFTSSYLAQNNLLPLPHQPTGSIIILHHNFLRIINLVGTVKIKIGR
jgi:hypothetical protein